jgi:hypothetical protein
MNMIVNWGWLFGVSRHLHVFDLLWLWYLVHVLHILGWLLHHLHCRWMLVNYHLCGLWGFPLISLWFLWFLHHLSFIL